MSASICIQVYSEARAKCETFKFFEAELWTSESQQELLSKMQVLLNAVKNQGKSFSVTVEMEVYNLHDVAFQIERQQNKKWEMNNHKLSIREIEVLGLIMQGLTNHEIADKLFISYETVRSHRKNILEKSGAKNTASLITYYHQTFFEK